MKGGFKVSLKANERIFINGAVVRVDRKTSLEFLNDVDFLLENHVLQASDATTPLKQLYYIVQIIVMAPNNADNARDLFRVSIAALLETFENSQITAELKNVDRLVNEKRIFEALKTIRSLFPIEDEILVADKPVPPVSSENPRELRAAAG
ncbi:MAG: flagellar biosynthesis repressor FlbT [Rhizobiaceae bacterium]